MPIFMDRHDVPGVTAEQIAQAHLADLEMGAKFGVQFLAYWFDADQGEAFCLAKAATGESDGRRRSAAGWLDQAGRSVPRRPPRGPGAHREARAGDGGAEAARGAFGPEDVSRCAPDRRTSGPSSPRHRGTSR
jgi:hypothetical protein